MKNKRILVLLGVVLLAVIIILIAYAYNLSKSPVILPPPSVEIKKIDLEAPSETDDKLAAIKKEFSTDSPKEIVNPVDGQLEEDDLIIINQSTINSAVGVISEIAEDSIIVDFDYQGTKWKATVLIDQNTSIRMPAPDANSMGEIVEVSSLKVGEAVIVNREGNILNAASFTGLSIHKIQ